MNKRLFVFGCSFTRWKWPTWNDYIGLNFDEYYSLGCGGADNKHILYKLLQADKNYKFTSDDCVMVMFSSFNRMSYIDKRNPYIQNIGDIIDHNIKAQVEQPYVTAANIVLARSLSSKSSRSSAHFAASFCRTARTMERTLGSLHTILTR